MLIRILLSCLLSVSLFTKAETYDVAINYGRVIDPETGLDGVRHVGVVGNKIVIISEAPLEGKITLDAGDYIVAPGFVDLHSHAITPTGQTYQLFDGVTTALELEAGAFPADRVSDKLDGKPLIHHGASLGYLWLRQWYLSEQYQPSLLHQPEQSNGRQDDWPSYGPRSAFSRQLTATQITELEGLLRRELSKDQSIGIGLPIDYIKHGLNPTELAMVFAVASELDQIVFIHGRRLPVGDLTGLNEVLEAAADSGASVHFCHLNSNALGAIDKFLKRVVEAKTAGVDISIEAYPYEAGSTQIGAAAFKGDWQTLYSMQHQDLVWVETGERLTPETFHRYQIEQPQGYIILFSNTMDAVDTAMLAPDVIVASDAMPEPSADAIVHPRGRGTFTRTLHRYVKQQGQLSWRQALAKMTLEPARRLQTIAPKFGSKGRLQEGADADIVVFDPNVVEDQATYSNPNQYAEGMRYVLVDGTLVIDEGRLIEGLFPGKLLDARLNARR